MEKEGSFKIKFHYFFFVAKHISMRKILLLISCISILSCQPPTPTPTVNLPTPTSSQVERTLTAKKTTKTKPDCLIKGKTLKENSVWLPDQSVLVTITCDSSTFDKKFGDSHRILSIYDTNNCQPTLQLTLPVNKSPDFPYYLADINYNHASNIVAVKGFNSIHCLNVVTKKMLPTLIPQFKIPRKIVDAQSGLIIHLENWEHFLIGYAQDQGVFVFNIKDDSTPVPVLPYAEYKVGDNQMNSIFLLPSSDNTEQAILPYYDWEEERFLINPLFASPTQLQQNVIKSALNNRYLVLEGTEKTIGVDLKKRYKVDLPADVQNLEVKKIVEWMEKNTAK